MLRAPSRDHSQTRPAADGHHHHHDPAEQKALQNRLRKIAGQVRAIEGMLLKRYVE